MGCVKRSPRILLSTTFRRYPSSLCSRLVYQACENMAVNHQVCSPVPSCASHRRLMTGVLETARLARAAPLSMGREASLLAGSQPVCRAQMGQKEQAASRGTATHSLAQEARGLSKITSQDCVQSSSSVTLNTSPPSLCLR